MCTCQLPWVFVLQCVISDSAQTHINKEVLWGSSLLIGDFKFVCSEINSLKGTHQNEQKQFLKLSCSLSVPLYAYVPQLGPWSNDFLSTRAWQVAVAEIKHLALPLKSRISQVSCFRWHPSSLWPGSPNLIIGVCTGVFIYMSGW